ncbi:MAG: hypothetical protein ABSD68_04350 [Candidatus Micrarchaeales archaeon]
MVEKEVEQVAKGISEIDPCKTVGNRLENRAEFAAARIYLFMAKLFVNDLKAKGKIPEKDTGPILSLIENVRDGITSRNPDSRVKTLECGKELSSAILCVARRAEKR